MRLGGAHIDERKRVVEGGFRGAPKTRCDALSVEAA